MGCINLCSISYSDTIFIRLQVFPNGPPKIFSDPAMKTKVTRVPYTSMEVTALKKTLEVFGSNMPSGSVLFIQINSRIK